MSLDVDLVALERQCWQALADVHGGEYYRQHLAEDALMAFPFGVMSRQAVIDAMEQAPPWSSFELTDPKVVELNDSCGVVVYRASAQRAGQPQYEATISTLVAEFLHRGWDATSNGHCLGMHAPFLCSRGCGLPADSDVVIGTAWLRYPVRLLPVLLFEVTW